MNETSLPPALDARLSLRVFDGSSAFVVEAELALPSGVLVLFGPSGVGKTLTLLALAGLLDVRAGHIRLGDETLFDAARGVCVPAHRRRVGYVPQGQALFPFLDVAENVAFGLPRGQAGVARARALIDELEISHLASAHPTALSGGERQRVALARALAVEPRLLLLDEPFASVDEEGRASLRGVVAEVVRRRGIPAVLVTHDASEAQAMGDHMVRFARGRTIAAGAPRALLDAR
jgi:molybdate transport system ATP-binding protein